MINHTALAVVAIVAALGLLGTIAIESIISITRQQQQQQAFAAGTNGSRLPGCDVSSKGYSASQGRCAGHIVIPP
jgi:streptogramin lyase